MPGSKSAGPTKLKHIPRQQSPAPHHITQAWLKLRAPPHSHELGTGIPCFTNTMRSRQHKRSSQQLKAHTWQQNSSSRSTQSRRAFSSRSSGADALGWHSTGVACLAAACALLLASSRCLCRSIMSCRARQTQAGKVGCGINRRDAVAGLSWQCHIAAAGEAEQIGSCLAQRE